MNRDDKKYLRQIIAQIEGATWGLDLLIEEGMEKFEKHTKAFQRSPKGEKIELEMGRLLSANDDLKFQLEYLRKKFFTAKPEIE